MKTRLLFVLVFSAVFAFGYVMGQEQNKQGFATHGFMISHGDDKNYHIFMTERVLTITVWDKNFLTSRIKRTRVSAHGGPFFPDKNNRVKENLLRLTVDFTPTVDYLLIKELKNLDTKENFGYQQLLGHREKGK